MRVSTTCREYVDADFLPHEPTYDFVSVDGRARCACWVAWLSALRSIYPLPCSVPKWCLGLCYGLGLDVNCHFHNILHRIHCMKRALPLVKPEGGIFMLDNSGDLSLLCVRRCSVAGFAVDQ